MACRNVAFNSLLTCIFQVVLVLIPAFTLGLFMSSCSSMKTFLGVGENDSVKPISNPFYSYHPGAKGETAPMILRTKKGDRSVEIEIPGDTQNLSDFVLPLAPAFKDSSGRSSGSRGDESGTGGGDVTDESYKNRTATPSDHEITRSFSKGTAEEEGKRREIEQSLSLIPSEDETPAEGTPSYLAAMDHIKQLYRATRYEAALLEIDDMVKQFQTDSKLYEMRGTLLDRLGRRELAVKSWSQALKLDPQNESLKKFVDRKQSRPTAGLQ